MNPVCEYCDKVIIGPVYERVIGWAKLREQGGTNALRARRTSDRFACRFCLDAIDRGIDPRRQGALFG